MDSVELLLDRDGEQRVLADWHRLQRAGLPSLADHRSPSNAPHVTLLSAPDIDGGTDEALAGAAAAALPLALVSEGLLVFTGRRGLVLARHVLCSPALATFQRTVYELLSGSVELLPTSLPGGWLPHLTLARGLSRSQLAEAVKLLDAGRCTAEAAALRRWDSSRKLQQRLPGP
ncbi:2'-5' RNA ligase family protein [Arthrobacter sp. I2-34]|uniref:2'-5' RNA ligase family protein n=1 Tax=Arthrobacter hankyongi TaxID=2904801 RepID=A0ABS9LAQ6_9MICC|nr:2'-5' RNA ligase family protein [Arthrobacter hankyongi]MCG2623745.1 2'-5' RNA ligase family protein [Arthrobacter hankyongi]